MIDWRVSVLSALVILSENSITKSVVYAGCIPVVSEGQGVGFL